MLQQRLLLPKMSSYNVVIFGDWLTTVDQRKFDSLLLTNKPYRQASLETHSSLECSIFIQIKETIQNTSFAQKSFAGLITFAPENELE